MGYGNGVNVKNKDILKKYFIKPHGKAIKLPQGKATKNLDPSMA